MRAPEPYDAIQIYRKDGKFSIETRHVDPDLFLLDAATALDQVISEAPREERLFTVGALLIMVVALTVKLKGYKADEVTVDQLLRVGDVGPNPASSIYSSGTLRTTGEPV